MGKEGAWKTIQSHKIVYPSELPNDDEILYTGWYYDEQTTQLAKEGTILNENTTLYTGFIRYYIVDEAIYCNTLTEALEIAQDGSTIKLLRDIEETESITIDKSITINTNGKTINFADGRRIYIDENKNVVIEGNGTLTVNTNASFIINDGNLVTNDVTIHRKSSYYSSQHGTINNSGNFTTNRCTISDITGGGITYINEGEYE